MNAIILFILFLLLFQFLAPFLYGLYWKKTSRVAVWTSFVFGAGFMLLNMVAKELFPAFLQSPINAGAFAMVIGLVIVPVVSLLTPKLDRQRVDEIFGCYDEPVTVDKREALD